jgi:heterodisulfide reductase subunit D
MNTQMEIQIKVPVMSELSAENKTCEYLFWVGSAGSYDDRAKKISRAFAKLLVYSNIDFAILGVEETDSGDVARRVGNEFLFQMQAMQNIETFKMYQVKKIITCCPHDYNTFKNEYPDYGYTFEVYHHSEFIYMLLKSGKLIIDKSLLEGTKISYHDPCYLGRGNQIYKEPRKLLSMITSNFIELKRNKARSLCCGAGGAQMFKEAEKGSLEVYALRTLDILEINPQILATSCPFCMLMLNDGLKMSEKNDIMKIYDIAEILAISLGL